MRRTSLIALTDGQSQKLEFARKNAVGWTLALRPVTDATDSAESLETLNTMLQGVVLNGTGKAAQLDFTYSAGKTGTSSNYRDAWFIGFDPDITVGVWVGFDQKKPIGSNQTGAVAALPIWQEIMKSWIARQRPADAEPPVFERPGNIVTVSTSRGPEVFIAGTQPQ